MNQESTTKHRFILLALWVFILFI